MITKIKAMKTKFTIKALRDIRPGARPYRIYDTELKGFVLRVQPSGAMTYYLEYRNAEGKKQTYRIGLTSAGDPHPPVPHTANCVTTRRGARYCSSARARALASSAWPSS
jgi:hypothetical protein